MDSTCPLIKDKCMGHGCAWFINLVGTNPNSGAEQNEWGCAMSWLPILLVENATRVRQAAASADKVANEVQKVATRVAQHTQVFVDALPVGARERLRQAEVTPLLTEAKNGNQS